ncbi:MAG: T9SS type A sorting domain-containing protein [candidate division WOR-3 bacterium]
MKSRIDPDVDVDSFNNVWVVWDSATWATGTGEVLYSKRDSLGGCLIRETDISNNISYSVGPKIAVDASNNIQFIWEDETPQGLGLWHAKLANDGSVIISPHIAVSGNNDLSPIGGIALNRYQEVNISWNEIAANIQITYTKLDSLGDAIIPKMHISPDSVFAYWSGIGVDSFANVHIGYRTNRTSTDSLAYTKLDKDGNILIEYKVLDSGLLPSIIVDKSQNIHIVYPHHGTTNWVINYLKLDQQGNIIVWPKTLSPTHHYSMNPHIAMDSLQYLHVVWNFNNWVDTMGIMYTKLDTLGNFVIPPMPVVYWPIAIYPALPRIAVDRNNRLHLVWMDQRLDSAATEDIFYKRGENEQTVRELERLKAQQKPQICAFPNPFTTQTKISFSLSQETEKGKIEIFDILGRRVREFFINNRSGTIQWDGVDDSGAILPSGVYFMRLSHAKSSQSVTVVLLR